VVGMLMIGRERKKEKNEKKIENSRLQGIYK
jgi:hypothetical protein